MCKIRYIVYAVLLVALAVFNTACGSNNEPDPGSEKDTNVVASVDRTVIVYMAANNSLGRYTTNSAGEVVCADTLDISEMKLAAKNGDFNGGRLMLYHANTSGEDRLYEVTADGLTLVKDYSDDGLISVNAERMKKVIADAKAAAPAKDYGLVLWSHGDGWLQDGISETTTSSKTSVRKAFGLETAYGKKMNITTLASVLDGENFSFIYFDCCYMASVEVEYELRNVTNYIVASVTELPVDGMPYDQNLRCMFAAEPDLVGAATNTFNYYNDKNDDWRSCTISVVRTDGLDDLAKATRKVYEKAESSLPTGYTPQRFVVSGSCYYFDLDNYVKALATTADYTSWQKALAGCVMYSAATPSMWPESSPLMLNYVCGLSTYIMESESDAKASKKKYKDLSWYNDVVAYLFK